MGVATKNVSYKEDPSIQTPSVEAKEVGENHEDLSEIDMGAPDKEDLDYDFDSNKIEVIELPH